jgi:hypothetical protein
MLPWALVLVSGFAIADGSRTAARMARAITLSVLPFALCAIVRTIVFGRPAPLSLLAKPSDFSHGALYAVAAALVTGGPLLGLAPIALRRAPAPARVIALAGFAHLAAVALAGGDWMPFARLVAPIVPSLLYAWVGSVANLKVWIALPQATVALVLQAYMVVMAAPAGRHVMRDRAALIGDARILLADKKRVASLDVGWPSASTEGEIIDLAGVTDPDVAVLPGGHTSKRVDAPFLLAKDPDVLLLYTTSALDASHLDAWPEATYGRVLEARLARDELVQTHFDALAFLPLGDRGSGYVVLARNRTGR